MSLAHRVAQRTDAEARNRRLTLLFVERTPLTFGEMVTSVRLEGAAEVLKLEGRRIAPIVDVSRAGVDEPGLAQRHIPPRAEGAGAMRT